MVDVTRHEEYYFDDGNLILLVEDHLYNVHRGVLGRHSDVFCSMLSLPQPTGPGVELEGSNDNVPVRLQDVLSVDFERLLWILYPPIVGELKPKTLAEWLSILDLSTRWAFEGVRNVAAREIEKLATDPVDRIIISRRFDIKQDWILPAYVTLCERRDPLSISEATRMNSIDIIARLSQAREAIQKSIWTRERETVFSQANLWIPPVVHGPSASMTADQIMNNISPGERIRREHLVIVAKFFDLPKPVW